MLIAFNSTGVFPPDSRGLTKQYMPPKPISWPCVSFVAMSFCSAWIWTVFCTEWFPENLVLHPAGIFKEIFAQLSTWVPLVMFDPLENNHGWNRTKYCAILFFSIRSLEITNILACNFSPFPSFFDFWWRRNYIFIFWNIGAVPASILTHLWNIQAYFKTMFSLRKGNWTEILLKSLASHERTGWEFILLFTRSLQSSDDWRPSMAPWVPDTWSAALDYSSSPLSLPRVEVQKKGVEPKILPTAFSRRYFALPTRGDILVWGFLARLWGCTGSHCRGISGMERDEDWEGGGRIMSRQAIDDGVWLADFAVVFLMDWRDSVVGLLKAHRDHI